MSIFYVYPLSYYQGSIFGGSPVSAITDTFGAWNDDGGFMSFTFTSAGANKFAAWNMTKFFPFSTEILGVTTGCRARAAGGGAAGVNFGTNFFTPQGGNDITTSAVGTSYENREKLFATNFSTSQPWQVTEMPDGAGSGFKCGINCEDESSPFGSIRLTGVWAAINYAGLSVLDDQSREIVSRRQWDLRKVKGMLRLTVPLHIGLDVEVGDDHWVEHIAGMSVDGLGWGSKFWQLRQFYIYEREVDVLGGRVTFTLRDRRDHLCMYRDTMTSPTSSSAQGVGVARHFADLPLDTYARAGNAWIMDPGSRLFVLKLPNERLYTVGAEAYPDPETNYVLQSAFKNFSASEFTGWTRNGENENGSIITEDLTNLLWDPVSTAVLRSCFMQVGDPVPANDLEIVTTSAFAASTAANIVVLAMMWHEDHDNLPMGWWIQRDVDSKYFEWPGTFQWETGKRWNQLPVIQTIQQLWDLYFLLMDVAAPGVTGFKMGFGVPASWAQPGQRHNLYAVKFARGGVDLNPAVNPMPILTEASPVSTSPASYTLMNSSSRRVYLETQGAIYLEVKPYFDGQGEQIERDVLRLENTAGTLALRVRITTGVPSSLEFIAQENGATTAGVAIEDIYFAPNGSFEVPQVTPPGWWLPIPDDWFNKRGKEYTQHVLIRWTGSQGELDLPVYTMDLFWQGRKATVTLASSKQLPVAFRDLALDLVKVGNAAGVPVGGTVGNFHVFQKVPDDAFAQRLTTPQTGVEQTIVYEMYTNLAAFKARLGENLFNVNFDDIDTSVDDPVAFSATRYQPSHGITISGERGVQHASQDFGFPSDYPPTSEPNVYAPGPEDDPDAPIGTGPHITDVTFGFTPTPALVAGFGCYFIDVDFANLGPSRMDVYGVDGVSIVATTGDIPDSPNASQLFYGFVAIDVVTNQPARAIGKVRLTNGTGYPNTSPGDGVVLDDFWFSEPDAC